MALGTRNKSVSRTFGLANDSAQSGHYWGADVEFPRIWLPKYRVCKQDHFTGVALDTSKWNLKDVSAAGTPVSSNANITNGHWSFAFDAQNEAQIIGCNENDKVQWDPAKGLNVEVGFTVAANLGSARRLIVGMGSAHNNTFDSVANNAWFRVDAGTSIVVESDDATTDNDDKSTGETLTALTVFHGRIEFRSVNDVRFYKNLNVRLASSTTFKVGTPALQFMALIQKDSGTTQDDLRLDYVQIAQKI
jgi:hypothetical protein